MQEVEGEERMCPAAQRLLQGLRHHGERYCGGRALPVAGAMERCEREVEAQEEKEQEVEVCQVRSWGLCLVFLKVHH